MAITVSPTFGAGNVCLKPVEYGGYGHYRSIAQTGATVSLTAGDPILSWRWTSTSANAILLRLAVCSNITSNITTAVNFDLQAFKATGFTASDSAGTAISSPTKGRTTMAASQLGDFRVATTGKLTAGTRTLDTNAFGFLNLPMTPTITNVGSATFTGPGDFYRWDITGEHPLLFVANEGFVVTVPVAANTSGGVRHTFTVEWAEVPANTVTVPGF